jgi:hypothetical protein
MPISALTPRRQVLASAALFAVAVLVGARSGTGQASGLPAELQATLIAKLVSYDRNYTDRAGDVALVVVLVKSGNAKSELSAATIKSALGQVDRIGGRPHKERVDTYQSPAALAELCRSKRVAVVYVTAGFQDEIAAIKSALTGVDVLTVAAVPEYVPSGIVLGFEVVSGKSKITLNLAQARQQRVDFKADALKLMKVYR